jgi:hypothetical protein
MEILFVILFLSIFFLIIRDLSNQVISAEYKDNIMTVKYSKGNINQYEFNSINWVSLPFMEKCDSDTEEWLNRMVEYNKKWDGPFPDSHKKDLVD